MRPAGSEATTALALSRSNAYDGLVPTRSGPVREISPQSWQRVMRALLLRLTGEERAELGRRDTDSVEAYHAYLKGRYHWNRRTEESLTRAIEHFEQAIEQDTTFALAFAGLSVREAATRSLGC